MMGLLMEVHVPGTKTLILNWIKPLALTSHSKYRGQRNTISTITTGMQSTIDYEKLQQWTPHVVQGLAHAGPHTMYY